MAEAKGKALLVKAIIALLAMGVLSYAYLPEAYCPVEDKTVKFIYMSDSNKTVTKVVPSSDGGGWNIMDDRCQKGTVIGEWLPLKGIVGKECSACAECPDVQVIAYTDNGKWFCNGIGADAECIKNEDIELPIY